MSNGKREQRPGSGLGGTIVRGGLLIVVLAVVGAVLGFAASSHYSARYTAKVTVLVSPLDGNPFNPDGRGDDLVNLGTEAQLVDSDAVASQVIAAVGGTSPSSVLSGLSVTVPANTQILSIQYEAGTKAKARERAQSFADSYLDFRVQRAQKVTSARTTRIQDELATQTKALDVLVKKLNRTVVPVDRAVLQQQVDGSTTQIGTLRTGLADLQTGQVDPGQVVTPAHIVSRAPGSLRALFTIGGAVAGLVVALLLVALLSRRRVYAREGVNDGETTVGPAE